jgi:hypothetical protein
LVLRKVTREGLGFLKLNRAINAAKRFKKGEAVEVKNFDKMPLHRGWICRYLSENVRHSS